MVKYKNWIVLAIGLLGVGLRIWTMRHMAVEFGGGDSSGRAEILLRQFESGYGWAVSSIWLPFYFQFFKVSLYFSKTINSILVLQGIISCLSIFVYYKLVEAVYDWKTSMISLFFFCIMPMHLMLTASALSEILFSLLVFLGLWSYIKRAQSNWVEVIGILFMLAAVMTRYEGWVLYVTLCGYDLIVTKSIKRQFLYIIPFCIVVGLHETAQMKEGYPFLDGLLGNPAESSMANIRGGLDEALKRFTLMGEIWHRNIGVLWYAFPIVIVKFLKKKSCNIFELFFYAVISMLIYSVGTNSIAVFERYFLLGILMCIPVAIKYAFSLKSRVIGFTLVCISLKLVSGNIFYFNSEYINPGAREIVSFIEKETNAKGVYVDDVFTMYLFEAFKVYAIDKNIKISHIHYDIYFDKFRRQSDFTYNSFIKSIEKINSRFFVLVEGSNLTRVLLVENQYKDKKPFVLVKKFGRYKLFKFKQL
jgi:hypothetical protein